MVRPPEPRLLNYLSSYDRHISSLALAAREVVLEEAPEAIESISKGYATVIGFSFTGKPLKDGFCYLAISDSRVNLGFNRATQLPDPNRVLTGTGKLHRHITFKEEGKLNRPYLRRYIQAAIELAGGPPPKASGGRPKAAPNRARVRTGSR
jgi:Domain of unknown function (DU1801)